MKAVLVLGASKWLGTVPIKINKAMNHQPPLCKIIKTFLLWHHLLPLLDGVLQDAPHSQDSRPTSRDADGSEEDAFIIHQADEDDGRGDDE